MGHSTQVVFVGMGQHKADQVFASFFDESWIREQQVDTRQGIICKGQAAVDSQPFAVTTIKRHIHADFACATQRDKEKFVSQFKAFWSDFSAAPL
jgi:hypothetical protein